MRMHMETRACTHARTHTHKHAHISLSLWPSCFKKGFYVKHLSWPWQASLQSSFSYLQCSLHVIAVHLFVCVCNMDTSVYEVCECVHLIKNKSMLGTYNLIVWLIFLSECMELPSERVHKQRRNHWKFEGKYFYFYFSSSFKTFHVFDFFGTCKFFGY